MFGNNKIKPLIKIQAKLMFYSNTEQDVILSTTEGHVHIFSPIGNPEFNGKSAAIFLFISRLSDT